MKSLKNMLEELVREGFIADGDLDDVVSRLKVSDYKPLKKLGYRLDKKCDLEKEWGDDWLNTWDNESGDADYIDGIPY